MPMCRGYRVEGRITKFLQTYPNCNVKTLMTSQLSPSTWTAVSSKPHATISVFTDYTIKAHSLHLGPAGCASIFSAFFFASPSSHSLSLSPGNSIRTFESSSSGSCVQSTTYRSASDHIHIALARTEAICGLKLTVTCVAPFRCP